MKNPYTKWKMYDILCTYMYALKTYHVEYSQVKIAIPEITYIRSSTI